MVAHHAQLPFLAYLINVALEQAYNERSKRRLTGAAYAEMSETSCCKIELQQNDMHFARLQACRANQLVYIDGARPERRPRPSRVRTGRCWGAAQE